MQKTKKMRALEQRYNMPIADLLLMMNWDQQMPTRKIADELGVCEFTIRYWFRRLELRSFFEPGRPYLDRNHALNYNNRYSS